MNIGDLLGAMMQSGMTPSANDRMRNSLAAVACWKVSAACWEDLRAEGLVGRFRACWAAAASAAGRTARKCSGRSRTRGRRQPELALGGLGALVGSLLEAEGNPWAEPWGRRDGLARAMAFQALKGSGQSTGRVPLGLMEPQTEADRQELKTLGARAEGDDQRRQGGR